MFRVLETFSGIGSQAKALKNIRANFEIVATSEWDIRTMIAYSFIHHGSLDLSKYREMSEEEVDKIIMQKTLTADGKTPITEKSVKRLHIRLKKLALAAIERTNNLGNIKDINIKNIPINLDLVTYSFPCQDLSAAGFWHKNEGGIYRNAQNRSSLLWEIERILLELKDKKKKMPKFLLMENVTNIASKKHIKDFEEWQKVLTEKLGYENYLYKLNANKFGIPQKRVRMYMISVHCGKNKKKREIVQNFFKHNTLENESNIRKRKDLKLEDIIKLDYSNPIIRYEADSGNPNDTESRKKIWDSSFKIYENGKISNESIPTITTKQDRFPNSGVIEYKSTDKNKSKFRYLTPRECFLLMGFEEKDYEVMKKNNELIAKGRYIFSNEKMIRFAGNSIVVNVLENIFEQMLEISDLLKKKK